MKKYFYKLRLIIAIKVLSATISTVAIAAIPYITKLLIDYDFSKGSKGIISFILMYLSVVIIGLTFEYISQFHAWKLARGFNLLIKEDIVDSILSYSYIKFNKSKLSTYISVLQNDVNVLEEHYIESIVAIVQTSIQVIIYAFYMIMLDVRIAIIIILFSSISLFLPNITSKILSERRGMHLNALASYIDKVKDILEGFKNVNYETKPYILADHNKTLHETENKLLFYGKFSTFTNIFNGSFMYLLDIVAFSTVAVLLLKSKITVGTAIATFGYVQSFIFPLRYIVRELSNIKSAKSAKEKIIKLLNDKEKQIEKKTKFKSHIKFSNVSVKFDHFELCNFNYTFEKGKKYAIIGHSGSGKSTVINLLMKYIKPTRGKILIDDINISEIDISGLIACVNQLEHIYSTDFFNNVTVFGAYSNNNIEDTIDYYENNKIKSISEKENCNELSGGEKNLLTLVRMKLTNRDIIILDEPFSALDIQNKNLMKDKVYGIENKTMIVVTHDLSKDSLKYFDEIIIINNGNIVKKGSTREIIESTEYSNLVKVV